MAPSGTFASPTYVTAPPGDGSRLAVVEQAGTVQLLVDGAKQATPLLDMSGTMPYVEFQQSLDPFFPAGPRRSPGAAAPAPAGSPCASSRAAAA